MSAVVFAASAAPVKVLPLGDSITYGCGDGCEGLGCAHECGFYQSSCQAGWRDRLWRRLSPGSSTSHAWDFVGTQQNGPDDIDRDNNGHPGWTIEHLESIADEWVALVPNVILLHVGTNNLGTIYNQTAAAALGKMSSLLSVTFTRLPEVHVYLSTLIGTAKNYGGDRHAEYNAGLKHLSAVFKAYGHNIDIVDMAVESGIGKTCDSMNCCNGWFMKDIHPNMHGYNRMADVWYNHLTAGPPSALVARRHSPVHAQKLRALAGGHA